MTGVRYADFDRGDYLASLEHRETPLGEYLAAQAGESFWRSSPGQIAAGLREGGREISDYEIQQAAGVRGANRLPPDPPAPGALTEETWRAGPSYREGLRWEPGLTEGQATARAEIFDENRLRRWIIENRRADWGDMLLGFGAAMVGGAADPANFIPFVGPGFRAAAAARVGLVGARAAEASVNAALGTAVSQIAIIPSRIHFGDEVTAADILTDIAVGAAVGATFGGVAGAVARLRGEHVPTVRESEAARLATSESAAAIAAGRSVDVSPNVVTGLRESIAGQARALPDALVRAGARDLAAAEPGAPAVATETPMRPADFTVATDRAPDPAIAEAASRVGTPEPRTLDERAAELGASRNDTDLEPRLNEAMRAGRIRPDDIEAIRAADQRIAQAEDEAAGIEAAAICIVVRA